MLISGCPSLRPRLFVCVTILLGWAQSPAIAQFGGLGGGNASAVRGPSQLKVTLAEPTPSRVYQRDQNGKAEIPIVLDESFKDAKLVSAQLSGQLNFGTMRVKFVDGKLTGVPTGGPYSIVCTIENGKTRGTVTVGPVFVGDLWVLAGQSNMEGVGNLIDVTPPDPKVMLLGSSGKWSIAEEPLHWLVDSPDPVHSGDPKTRAERSAQTHKHRNKGAGLGLPFAVAMVEATGVPVGLVACAHGGTSMEQWNPSKKGEGGNSLYGSMLRQVKLAGGKVKGVLWYQGESDAMSEGWKTYAKTFPAFIAAVRSDLGQPELPFYLAQIGRFVRDSDPKGWNTVQNLERMIPEQVPNTAVVSVIDLELDDGIHVGTQGLKRVGHRLAKIALRNLFGQVGATTPTFDKVTRGQDNTLIVKFSGVNMGAGRGTGAMAGMMNGMMGRNNSSSAGESTAIGLKPERHIAGFSICKEDGTPISLIFEAAVGKPRDTVVLKLNGPVPEKATLYYGHGMNPYCNLVDSLDMAVPVFGPIPLDAAAPAPTVAAATPAPAKPTTAAAMPATAAKPAIPVSPTPSSPVKALIITGDTVSAHDWKLTTKLVSELLESGGKVKVDVTTTPTKDLTDGNLAKYDVLVLNYKDTPAGAPETKWSDANKEAFLKAIHDGGKGLALLHHASSAFVKPNWDEFEKAIAGGWRTQGFHGPPHVFSVKKTATKHEISTGLPVAFEHTIDELYQNSMITPGSTVLATAYSDPGKPKGTGKDEPIIWVNTYGKGRVYENVMGHDATSLGDPNFQAWFRRGVIWAGKGKLD
jgi:sialate O-acetylesterase